LQVHLKGTTAATTLFHIKQIRRKKKGMERKKKKNLRVRVLFATSALWHGG